MNAVEMERHYAICFINTRLAGGEYVIREERASFIVADRDALALFQQQSADPTATYILDDSINTRFEIVWHSSAPLPLLMSYRDGGITERTIPFHQTIDVDGVCFTLRPQREEHQQDRAVCQASLAESAPEPVVKPLTARQRRRPFSVPALLTLLLLAGAGYYLLTRQEPQQINSVTQLLGGRPYQFTTFVGHDSAVYVLARDASSSAWAWQSLIKNDAGQQITVLSTREEEDKIARELGSRWPQLKFHAVRFDDPAKPEIILSQERTESMTPQELEQVSAKMVTLFPWSSRFIFSTLSDYRLAETAEQGLRGIIAVYDKRSSPDNVTFSISGKLNDSELNALKKYVSEFRRKWRGDYIQFDIALKDNMLQGNSRLYGNNGYVKISPEQWYFPEIH
mgnify:CR=1 FL=1